MQQSFCHHLEILNLDSNNNNKTCQNYIIKKSKIQMVIPHTNTFPKLPKKGKTEFQDKKKTLQKRKKVEKPPNSIFGTFS